MDIKTIIIYEGKNCNLCLLQENLHFESCLKFINNDGVTLFLANNSMVVSRAKEKAWFEKTILSETDVVFAIETKKGKYIGNIGLHKINYINRSAELGIIIGDKSEWGKGIASEAETLVIRHAFIKLNLNKVIGLVIKDNIGSQKAGKNNNFVLEGTLRQYIYSNGKYHDVIIGSVLREDWLKN